MFIHVANIISFFFAAYLAVLQISVGGFLHADLRFFGGLGRAYEGLQHVAAKFARRRKRIDAAAERISEFAARGEVAVG